MRTRALACVLSLVGCLSARPASAQGVLSSLGQLSLDGASIDDPRAPIARRVSQARALGRLGEPTAAVAALTSTLSRRPPQALRDAVVMSLAERRSPLAVPELLRALRARVGSVGLIYDALTAIGGAPVTEALLERLSSIPRSDRVQRALALSALAQVAPTQAAPLLRAAINDADAASKAAAVQIAVEHPHALWVESLASLLVARSGSTDAADISWALARAADGVGLSALLNGVTPASDVELHRLVAIAVCLRAYRQSIDGELVARALHVLRSVPSAATRLELRALALDPVSIDDVKVALGHQDATLRRAGARAVEWLTITELSVPPSQHTKASRIDLRRVLRSVSADATELRVAAALELARLADPTAHVPLIAALADPDSRVRRAAVRGLAMLDREEGRSALLRHAALEIVPEIADLAIAGVARQAIALDDPWAKARQLLEPVVQVDRQPSPLAR